MHGSWSCSIWFNLFTVCKFHSILMNYSLGLLILDAWYDNSPFPLHPSVSTFNNSKLIGYGPLTLLPTQPPPPFLKIILLYFCPYHKVSNFSHSSFLPGSVSAQSLEIDYQLKMLGGSMVVKTYIMSRIGFYLSHIMCTNRKN